VAKILLLNGPNLNLLGTREPEVYGSLTLEDIETAAIAQAADLGHELIAMQSNSESALVERVQAAKTDTAFIILNPGAYTHTSVALRDALLGVGIPFIEIHLSNIQARESFRQHSYFSDIAAGVISGLGATGYKLALLGADEYLQQENNS
jgi:3-dehydroquinate dehydratase-2